MDTDHSAARTGIGILTYSDTAGIILAHRCAKGKGLFQRAIHIDNGRILANDDAVALVDIAVDIGIITNRHITGVVTITSRTITFHEIIITNRNGTICFRHDVSIAEANNIGEPLEWYIT